MTTEQLYFGHERLDVFKLAVEFAVEANDILVGLRRRPRGDLADQLRRASASIVLNIAEGAAELKLNEKQRLYRMARRSAAECAAVLSLLAALNLVSDARIAHGRSLLLRIMAMLSRMVG